MIRYGATQAKGREAGALLHQPSFASAQRPDRTDFRPCSTEHHPPAEGLSGRHAPQLAAVCARFRELAPQDAAALGAIAQRQRLMRAEQVLIHEGEIPANVYLVTKGFAYRYKLLSDGRRQILGFLIPGDFCEIELPAGALPDHCVAALNAASVAVISVAGLAALRVEYPNIDRLCSLVALTDRSILREWLMNMGQRNAIQRIGHFLCEITVRMEAIGEVSPDGSIDLPLTQAILADTTGLTIVHVNRSLKRLRDEGLVALRGHRLMILDRGRLEELTAFTQDYLRLAG